MGNKKKFVILLLILLILVAGVIYLFLRLGKQTSDKKSETAQNSNINKIIAVLDKPFYVDLPANPSTGYQWQADFDTKLIKLNNTSFSQANNPNIVGSEVTQTFEFQPLEKTDTTITFRYVRPWEINTPPAETKLYNIIIQ